MAISYVNNTYVHNNATCGIPASTALYDVMVAMVGTYASTAVVGPSNWLKVLDQWDGNSRLTFWLKPVGNGEPASYTWSGPPYFDIDIAAFRGVDNLAPVDGLTLANNSTTAPSVYANYPGDMLFCATISDQNSGSTPTAPAGMTSIQMDSTDENGDAYQLLSVRGHTGTRYFNISGANISGSLLLKPQGTFAAAFAAATPTTFVFPAASVLVPAPYREITPLGYTHPVGGSPSGVSISATLQGVGSLSVAPLTVQVNSLALSGVGSLSVAPLTVQVNSVTLAGVGSLSVSPLTVQLQGVTLAGVGSLALTPLTVQLQNVTLGGVGSLSATLVQQEMGAAWPTVTPAGFTFPVGVIPPPAPYREITPLTYTYPVGSPPSGAVSVTATLQGVGALTLAPLTVQLNAVTLAGVGTLSASPLTVQLVGVTLPGVGSLALAPLTVQLNSVTLVGMGVLALSPLTVQVQSVSLSGVGALSLAVLVVQLQGVALSGAGTLAAAFVVLLGAQALRGVGSLAGTPQVLGANSLVDATVTALVRDGTVTLLVRDGKANALVRDGDNTTEVR